MQEINYEEYPREEITPKKLTDYTILTAASSLQYYAVSKLCAQVNEYIQKGWYPQGGVCVAIESGAHVLCQAMVKI